MILNKFSFYLSSMVFGNDFKRIQEAEISHQFPVEFSSGLPFDPQSEEFFFEYKHKKLIHNYFPAPEVPFVLNLASVNKDTRRKSVEHCIMGLELTAKVNAPFYCAHAGFLIDPQVDELGNAIDNVDVANNKKTFGYFIESLNLILEQAKRLKVDFYIENNVLAPFNFKGKVLPFFCCESSGILEVFKHINHPNFGLLLDTAHLKVSCKTLGLALKDQIDKIGPYVKAIHHSDNNGTKDTNDKITPNYWFLDHIKDFKHVPHVLEVKKSSIDEIKLQLKLLEDFIKK